MAVPSERTKAQKDNVFLFMRVDISHKSLNNTTLFLYVPIFKNLIHRLSFYARRFFLPPFQGIFGRAVAKNRGRLIRDAHPGDGLAANNTYAGLP